MSPFLTYPDLNAARQWLLAKKLGRENRDDRGLCRAVRAIHDREIGDDPKHVYNTELQCLDHLCKELGDDLTGELVLTNIDRHNGLERLLNRLQNDQGLPGLTAYAKHLLSQIEQSGVSVGRYREPMDAVHAWLDRGPNGIEPSDAECMSWKKKFQMGGMGATSGLRKLGCTGAAIQFVLLHILQGIDVDRLLQASRMLESFFYNCRYRPETRHAHLDSDEVERLLKSWIANRLGDTCSITGQDLRHTRTRCVVGANLKSPPDHLQPVVKLHRNRVTRLSRLLSELRCHGSLLQLLEVDLPPSSAPNHRMAQSSTCLATELIRRFYESSGGVEVSAPASGGTFWCSSYPERTEELLESWITRAGTYIGVLAHHSGTEAA